MKVLVCDDDPTSARTWVEQIETVVGDGVSVERLDDAVGAIQVLVDRKKAAAENGKFADDRPSLFDAVDILVVDYDLILIDTSGNRTTGEGVARLVKTYSCCNLVVVLNQFSKIDFDLTMTGHLDSWADVNIEARSVSEPRLWRSDVANAFAPSYWMPLLEVAGARADYAKSLAGNLDVGILESLGLKADDLEGISDRAFAFLSEKGKVLDDLGAVTVRGFLEMVLGKKDADPLLASPPAFAARLATSRFAKWLDRAVLRPLDAMIDASHLLERRPYLGNADAARLGDIEWWQGLRGKEADALREDVATAARLEQVSALLGRDVYGIARLETDAAANALADAWDFAPTADVVFAEDSSRFVRRDSAQEFRAGFGNFNDRRFVEKLDGKTYGPTRRFAFGD